MANDEGFGVWATVDVLQFSFPEEELNRATTNVREKVWRMNGRGGDHATFGECTENVRGLGRNDRVRESNGRQRGRRGIRKYRSRSTSYVENGHSAGVPVPRGGHPR